MDEIAFGLRALRGIPVDRIPPTQRMKFRFTHHEVESDTAGVDAALRDLCRSELVDALVENTGKRRNTLVGVALI